MLERGLARRKPRRPAGCAMQSWVGRVLRDPRGFCFFPGKEHADPLLRSVTAMPPDRILAGIGGLNDGQIMDDFERFFAVGGLAAVDAVEMHHYPGVRSPEFIEGLAEKLGSADGQARRP